MSYTRTVILLAAFVACAQSLPAAQMVTSTRTARPTNLELRGGGNALLTENQVLQVSTALLGLTGIPSLLAPEFQAKLYQVKANEREISDLGWFGSTAIIGAALLYGTGILGKPLKEVIGYTGAFQVLYLAFQMFSPHGAIQKCKLNINLFYFWLLAHMATVYLSFTDFEQIDKVIKFWAVVCVVHGIFPTFFFDSFVKSYGDDVSKATKLQEFIWKNNGTLSMAIGAWLWVYNSEGNMSAAMFPWCLSVAILKAYEVGTQAWRDVGMPNGVANALWLAINSFLAYTCYKNK